MRKVLMGGLCLALLGGLTVLGQDRDAPREGKRTHVTHRASTLLGATVSIKGGDSLGKVLDLVVDEHGIVEYLIVQVDQGLLPVPWGAVQLGSGERATTITIVTELPRDRLKEVIFTEKSWPDFYSDQWLRTATTVWGERTFRRDFRPDVPRKDEIRRDETRKDDTRRDDVRKDDTRRDDVRKDEARKDVPRKDETRRDDVRKDDVRKDDVRRDDVRKDDVRKDDARKDVPRKDDVRKDDVRKDDIRKDDTRKDVPRKDDIRKDDRPPAKDRPDRSPADRPPQ